MNPNNNTARKQTVKAISLALSLSTLALASVATQASAANRQVATERFTEYARVIDVQPVFRQVRSREPRQECWIEEQRQIVGYENTRRTGSNRVNQARASQNSGNTIVGSIIGGVIGNQLGRSGSSNARTGATVAGAIIGGAIANESGSRVTRHRNTQRNERRFESRPVYETTQVEQCKRVTESVTTQQLQHYNVTYKYKGRTFTTQLPRDPGNQLELQVSVAPARR